MTPATIALLCAHIATGYPAPNYDLHVTFEPEGKTVTCIATEQRYGDMFLVFHTTQYDATLAKPIERHIEPGETSED